MRIAWAGYEHQCVQVGVEVGSTAKALDEGDGAGGGLLAFDARLLDEMAVDGATLLGSGCFETLAFPHACSESSEAT